MPEDLKVSRFSSCFPVHSVFCVLSLYFLKYFSYLYYSTLAVILKKYVLQAILNRFFKPEKLLYVVFCWTWMCVCVCIGSKCGVCECVCVCDGRNLLLEWTNERSGLKPRVFLLSRVREIFAPVFPPFNSSSRLHFQSDHNLDRISLFGFDCIWRRKEIPPLVSWLCDWRKLNHFH